MGHTRLVKWMAQNQDRKVGVYGDTKEQLLFAMSQYPFERGDRVMIMRQSPRITNYSKVIIYGQEWTMPTRDDNEFGELLKRQREEFEKLPRREKLAIASEVLSRR